jgi:hypothetical protein
MRARVTAVVTIASRTDSHSEEVKPFWLTTPPNAEMPLKRSAPHSGSRKYTAVTSSTAHRHAGSERLRRFLPGAAPTGVAAAFVSAAISPPSAGAGCRRP